MNSNHRHRETYHYSFFTYRHYLLHSTCSDMMLWLSHPWELRNFFKMCSKKLTHSTTAANSNGPLFSIWAPWLMCWCLKSVLWKNPQNIKHYNAYDTKFLLEINHLQQLWGIDVTYSPDVTRVIAVKTGKYTTQCIAVSGWFFGVWKTTRNVNVVIFLRNTTTWSFYN